MADKIIPEKLRASETSETIERGLKPELKETTTIQKEASRVFEAGGVEVVSGKEKGVEFAEGKVSETVTEQKKKGPAGVWPVTRTADEVEAIRAKLLQNLPSQEMMVHQIKQTLRGQEQSLNKQYKKLKRMGDKAAYQLNIVVAQLRKIREFFSMLANATFEIIKQLWLKIVHGV